MSDRRLRYVGFVLLAGLAAMVLLVLALLLLARVRRSIASTPDLAPQVEILAPIPGTSLTARDEQAVEIRGFARDEIARYELWVDGRLDQGRDFPPAGEGAPTQYVFLWRPAIPGASVLVARAYDRLGRVATSSPRVVEILPWRAPDVLLLSYEVRPGDTLPAIAESFGVGPDQIALANPGIPPWPPPGEGIRIPVPGERLPEGYLGDDGRSPPERQDFPLPAGVGIGEAKEVTSTGPRPQVGSTPPPGPDALEATATGGCGVGLSWTDLSDFETGFRVYRYGATSLDFAPVANFESNDQFGALTFRDEVPLAGSYQYFVTAVNAGGEAASPIRQIDIPDGECPASTTALLQIEVLNLTTTRSVDRPYCYFSHEFAGRDYSRLPSGEDAFLAQDEDGWDIEEYGAGVHRIVFAHAPDQPIPVAMECWAWSGGELVSLGSFHDSHPQADWDTLIPAQFTGVGAGFRAVYTIQVFSNLLRTLIYEFDCPLGGDRMTDRGDGDPVCDSGIPAPRDVRRPADRLAEDASGREQAQECYEGHANLEGGTSLDGAAAAGLACISPSHVVVWEWDGVPSEIQGFHVSFEYAKPAEVYFGGIGTRGQVTYTIGSMAQLFWIPRNPACNETLTIRVYAFAYETHPPGPYQSEGGTIPDPPNDYFVRTSPNSVPYRIYGPPCPVSAQVSVRLQNLHVQDSEDVDGVEALCFFCATDRTQEAYGILKLFREDQDGGSEMVGYVTFWTTACGTVSGIVPCEPEDYRSITNRLAGYDLAEESLRICVLVDPDEWRCRNTPHESVGGGVVRTSSPVVVFGVEDGDTLSVNLRLYDDDDGSGDDVWCSGSNETTDYTARAWARADESWFVGNFGEDQDASCFIDMHIEGVSLGGITPPP